MVAEAKTQRPKLRRKDVPEYDENGRKIRVKNDRPNMNPGSNPKGSAALKAMWADPVKKAELLAKRAVKMAERKGKQMRIRIPDGYTKAQAEFAWAKAEKEATEIMTALENQGVFEDISDADAAKEALKFNITVVRGPYPLREKLAASAKVLEFTKAKPAAKSEVTINKAEEWLAAIVAADKNAQEVQEDSADTDSAE